MVSELWVVPEGLAQTSAAVQGIVDQLIAAHAAAAPLITLVPPAGADPVSIATAAGFNAIGAEHVAVGAQGTEELGRAAIGVGESGISYAVGDAAAAANYTTSSAAASSSAAP